MARLFCGFIDFDRQTSPNTALEMTKGLNFNNLYKIENKSLGPAYFVNLYSTNNPKHPDQRFLNDLKDRYIIASFTNLVRIERLIKLLDLNTTLEAISEEELLLRAYQKWGQNMVHHLYGDWSFVIFDLQNNEIFLSRNANADGTLFYHQSGKRLYFCSIITGLVKTKDIPLIIDPEKFFFENLTISKVPSKTIYKDIHFLRPGHSLVFSEKGMSQNQYWQPQLLPKLIFKKESDYFEALLERFTEAVELRLRKSHLWGIGLSGGLDSGATIAIASNYFRNQNRSTKAFTYSPDLNNSKTKDFGIYHSNERYYADFSVQKHQNIDLEVVEKYAPFWQYLAQFSDDFGTPSHIHNNWFADALIEQSQKRGLPNLLITQGGNDTISYYGISSHKTYSQLLEDLKFGLKLEPTTFLISLLKSIVGSSKQMIKPYTSINRSLVENKVHNWSFLKQYFVKNINGYKLLEDHLFSPVQGVSPAASSLVKRMGVGSNCRLGLWNMLGARHDVLCVDPSRDKLLQEFILSIPNHIFNKRGEEKFLYKRTFRGMVPEEILTNKKTGFSFPDIVDRYQNDCEFYQDTVSTKRKDPILKEMIDYDRLINFYKDVHTRSSYDGSYILDVKRKDSSSTLALFTPTN